MERVDTSKVILGGTPVDLMDPEAALEMILGRAVRSEDRPLAVASVNLDHLNHFGAGRRWAGTLHDDPASAVDWLYLLDGAPLVAQSHRLTGRRWPRLAGSDLASPLLLRAEELGLRVGFLGGSEASQRLLAEKFVRDQPGLQIAGMWSPARNALASGPDSEALARQIAESGVQLLYVGLGKPRQELWIDRYGGLTGAEVLLAFGAAVDFLAGRMGRAPKWVSDHGLEWGYRLALEPRRLAGRYLLGGAPSYLKLRTDSSAVPPAVPDVLPSGTPAPRSPGRFTGPDGAADAVVVVVTYNSAGDIDALLGSLRAETSDLTLRVLVADNSSRDGTLGLVQRRHPDVIAFGTGGNLGYSAGINAALRRAGDAQTVVILNPDLLVKRGSLAVMMNRLQASRAGAVVPRLVDSQDATLPSLYREPSITRAIGDAFLGRRAPDRPGWLATTDFNAESYAHAHPVQWATGAALMVQRSLADALPWDESYFLYSEETDFFHRMRMLGQRVWYEPAAAMTHKGGGSGESAELNALMAVNRVRYVRKYHSAAYAGAFHAVLVLSELLRCWKPDRAGVLWTVVSEDRWAALPGPVTTRHTVGHTVTEVVGARRAPLSAVNAALYLGFAVAGRRGSKGAERSERDESSHGPAAKGGSPC
ncbi:WecB/TagA/CpsF family glycosyltransferase [Arthrobacter sp. YAF34]|uniref:WecB/TagA/CpsF family glycosyltransferase n=1 Tax=Arthrobacter sp. YAF34 TaxID=3233083 RepID=UPI003F938F20